MNGLDEVLAVWRAAEQPCVRATRIRWPELEDAWASALALREHTEMSSVAGEVLSAMASARRVLMWTPLGADHDLAGVPRLLERIGTFAAERMHHPLCEYLQALMEPFERLRHSPSPYGTWFGDVLSEYGEFADGTPEALVLVPRRAWAPAVQEWLRVEEFSCVDVLSVQEARTAVGAHTAVVLAGHPATMFASHWVPATDAQRDYGWLFTAPPAPVIRLALAADSRRLDARALWLLGPGTAPSLEVDDPRPGRTSEDSHSPPSDEPDPVAVPALHCPVVAHGDGDAAAAAVGVSTASGHSVYFHPEIGPRPTALLMGEQADDVALRAIGTSDLRPGTALLVRVGEAAHELLVLRADAWLTENRGWPTTRIANARALALELKAALRHALSTVGHHVLLKRLTDRCIEPDYARVLLINPLDAYYIAPQRLAAFQALVDAIGATDLRDRFTDLVALRTAQRRGGDVIRHELRRLLRDQEWSGELEADGSAALHGGQLGTLLVTYVVARAPAPVHVPSSCLGALIDSAGRRVLALA